jgi:TonB-linked SusC/RagA family outer membrane protein
MHPSRLAPIVMMLTLMALRVPAVQAQGSIAGRVAESRATQPIAGATLEVEGTGLGAITDDQGRYRIANVPAGSYTLIARRIGYAPSQLQVAVVNQRPTTVDFTLQTSAIGLDRIVVTGTAGGERLRTIGSSVATISANDVVSLGQPPDLGSLLNARAPGLLINQGTGRIGTAPSITIRGTSSIGLSNAPLLYIDGVRMDNATQRLNDIHPQDIESIEVIKGPAAATIYGTEASNGVIQLITKKGAAGAPQFTMQAQYGSIFFRDADGRMPTNYLRDAGGNVVAWNAMQQEKERGTPLFEPGNSKALNGSISGGLGGFNYYLSSAYTKEKGIEPSNYDQLFSLQSNLDLAATPKFNLATTLRYADSRIHFGTADAFFRAYYGHGLLFPQSRGFVLGVPPEVFWALNDDFENVNRFTVSSSANHTPTSWLTQRLITGVDFVGGDSRALRRFAPPEYATYLNPTAAAGQITQTLRRTINLTGDYSATARFNLRSALTSASSFGLQVARLESTQSVLGGRGFPAPGLETVSAAATPLPSTQTDLLNTTVGAFAQEQFGWRDRLFVTAALRVDNNSAFGENFRWVTYPKVDASWVIDEEPFWRWGSLVDRLRARVAYGESGRAPSAFSALRTFTPVQGPGGSTAATPGALGNPELRPERGKEFEFGFDASLFNRLTLDYTHFNKKTVDVIINQLVAPSVGFPGSVPLNLGQVNSGGFELTANLLAVTRARVQWEIGANFSRAESMVMDLGAASGSISASGQFNRVGYPINGQWTRRVVSADRNPTTQLATNILCDAGPGAAPVACASAPFQYMGPSTPTTSGAVFNTITLWKRLRLYGLVDFRGGNRRFNTDDFQACTGSAGGSLCLQNMYPDRYPVTEIAQVVATAISQHTRDWYYEDASFAKLRELSVAYDIPARFIPGVSSASLTLAGKELATWTKSRALDPENNQQSVTPPLSRVNLTLSLRM